MLNDPRLKRLRLKLKAQNLDGLLVTSQANITYLTKYLSRDSYLLTSGDNAVFFTDSRYTQEVKSGLGRGIRIEKINGALFKSIAAECRKSKIRRLGVEGKNTAFWEYGRLEEALGKKIKLTPTANLVEGLREVKSGEEIAKIAKAAAITVKAFRFIRSLLKPGKREIEIAAELERFIRYAGARTAAFEIIVASGPNSCYPHHITGRRRIKNNQPVLIDMGVDYEGYKSDLTRVFFLGKINSLHKKIYSIVLEAQSRAISQIKSGTYVKEVDAAARDYIAASGYGDFFGHGTGHAIGLETHEDPRLWGKVDRKLAADMIVTVEPGIYLPGKFGVRIEDMVLVTQKGYEVLSGSLHK